MSRSIPIALLMLILASANAAEPSAYKEPSAHKEPSAYKTPSALVCSGCHGGSALLPDLSDYSATQLNSMMLAFKSGARESTLMGRLARGYTDDELATIAQILGRK
jgi:cytochrome c553